MEKQGRRLSSRYPKYLAAFGAWLGIGMGLAFIALQSWLWGVIMIFGGALAIAIAVEGSRMKERDYTNLDLAVQWVTLALPIVFISLLVVLLFTNYFRPFLGPVLAYLAGLIVIAVLAAKELRRGVSVG